jgi:MFS family permease
MTSRREFAGGWRVLAGSLLGISIGVSSIYFYSLGVFIKPLAAAFHWGRGEASLGALVGTAGAALVAVPVGRLVDRFGSVKVAITSLILLALSFAGLGLFTSGIASFLVLTVLLSLLTAGSSPLPYTRLVVAAFDRRRGMALGVILAGTGLGAILIPALLTPFVATHGWRAGDFALAALIVMLTPILLFLLISAKTSEPVRGERVPISRFVSDPVFRRLALIFFLASVAVLGTVVQFVPMLTDGGMSPAQAGGTAALLGLTSIAGRLVTGFLLDRVPPLLVTGGVFLAGALGVAVLGLGGPAFAVVGALIVGLTVGAEVDLMAFLIGRHFPRVSYGQFYGAIYAVFLMGGAIGPALSGYMQQASGSYRLSLLTAAALLTTAAFLAWRLSRATNREFALNAPVTAPN